MLTLNKDDLDKISQMLSPIALGQALPIWEFLSRKVVEQAAQKMVTQDAVSTDAPTN